MIVLIDCDGVLSDFTGRLAEGLWADWGFDLRYDDITTFDFSTVPDWRPEFWDICREPGFVAEMKTMPESREAVNRLRELGCEVICATAPFDGAPHWAYERQEWLKHHFGFAHKDIVQTHRKDLLRGDILVDDRYEHARDFPGIGLLWNRPWNESTDYARSRRVSSWDEVIAWAKHRNAAARFGSL